MFARSTTINGDSGNIDDAIAFVRDQVMPELTRIPGCVGISMMVDRESGRSITTSSWESEDAMRASAGQVTGVRSRAAEIAGGMPMVDEWEVMVMHRDHEAHETSCCRVTWMQSDPEDLDKMVDYFKHTTLPTIEQAMGFCSASLLVNRASGRACVTARFEDRQSMTDSASTARDLRESAMQDLGIHIMDVEMFDLAVAHLRVPELV
jgi:hypothetical protein